MKLFFCLLFPLLCFSQPSPPAGGGGGSGTVSPATAGQVATYTGPTTVGGDPNFVYVSTALGTPTAPVLATHGTPGVTTYGYRVMAFNSIGHSIQSAETTIATGNAALDGTNFISIATAALTGATSCSVYQTTPAIGLLVGNVACGGTVNDQGTLLFEQPFYYDASAGASVVNNLIAGNRLAIGSTIEDQTFNQTFLQVPGGAVLEMSKGFNSSVSNNRTTNAGLVGKFLLDPGTSTSLGTFYGNSLVISTGAASASINNGNDASVQLFNSSFNNNSPNVNGFNGITSSAYVNSTGAIHNPVGFFSSMQDFGGGITGKMVDYSTDNLTGSYADVSRVLLRTKSSGTVSGTLIAMEIEDQNAAPAGFNYAVKTGLGKVQWGDVQQDASVEFASLPPSPVNGMQIYCSDCKVTSGVDDTCANTGTGAKALRINGAWKCVQ